MELLQGTKVIILVPWAKDKIGTVHSLVMSFGNSVNLYYVKMEDSGRIIAFFSYEIRPINSKLYKERAELL